MLGKQRIIKSYEKLPKNLIEKLNEKYPDGYADYMINIRYSKGQIEVAIPFETDDIYYLIKLPHATYMEEGEAEAEAEVESSSSSSYEFEKLEDLDISEVVESEEE